MGQSFELGSILSSLMLFYPGTILLLMWLAVIFRFGNQSLLTNHMLE